MKNNPDKIKPSDFRIRHGRGFFLLCASIIAFWPTHASGQEFNAIVNELNNLEKKLTRIVQNEAIQRKASDSAIVKAIGRNSSLQQAAPDSAVYAEISHIKRLIDVTGQRTDSIAKSLTVIQRTVDSLVKIQPDTRVVELATMLQQIIGDFKKELLQKTTAPSTKPQPEEKKVKEEFKAKTEINGIVFAQYGYDASEKPSIDNDGFSIERAYVDLKGQVSENISGRITLDLDPKATTFKYAYVKYAYADYSILKGSLIFRAGQQETPWIGFTDKAWKYRSVEKNLSDYNKILSSADIGAGAVYKLPGAYGEMVTQVINGNSYKNTNAMEENNFQKDFAARVSINPLPESRLGKGLSASMGFQYKNSSSAPSAVTNGLIAYDNGMLSAGVEGLGATLRDSLTRVVSLRTIGLSMFGDVSMPFHPRAGILARYDNFNPNNAVLDNGSSLLIVGARYRIHAKHTMALVYEQNEKQKSGSIPVKLVKIVLESKF